MHNVFKRTTKLADRGDVTDHNVAKLRTITNSTHPFNLIFYMLSKNSRFM